MSVSVPDLMKWIPRFIEKNGHRPEDNIDLEIFILQEEAQRDLDHALALGRFKQERKPREERERQRTAEQTELKTCQKTDVKTDAEK